MRMTHFEFLICILLVTSLALECDDSKTYISVFKQNSKTKFNQREESFLIRGTVDRDYVTFVTERPLVDFKANKTYEYCLPKTKNLVYDVILLDEKGNGWDDGSYIEIRNKNGFLLFKGQSLHGEREVYRIRLTYILSPYQNWGVLKAPSRESLLDELREYKYEFASFEQDYLKEDENQPEYDHKVIGVATNHNFYVNYFNVDHKEFYSGLEIGITNDFLSVSIYINNILVFSEHHHKNNNQNYYRILLSGTPLQSGRNSILFEFDQGEHINNVYLYGYPAYAPQQCLYIPNSHVVDHSPVVEGHDVNLAFDYSTDYFYFNSPRNVHLTFSNTYFDVFEIDKYIVYDYVFAYAPRNWTLAGSTNQKIWFPIDRQDEPSVDHIFKRYEYYTSAKQAYPYYKYTILENKGLEVVWLPELYPYVCHRGFAKPLYNQKTYSLAYNVERTVELSCKKELEGNKVTFSIEPALPETMKLDEKTGDLKGSFGYEYPKYSYFTVTAKGEQIYQKQTLTIQLDEGFSFDTVVINGKVQTNNIYAEPPLFVLFIVFALAACMILFFILELVQYLRL